MGMKLRDWGLCGEQGICLRGIGEQGGGILPGDCGLCGGQRGRGMRLEEWRLDRWVEWHDVSAVA